MKLRRISRAKRGLSWKWINSLDARRIRQLQELFRNEWWTRRRSLPQIRRMLKHSNLILGAVDEKGFLIGFARVITDFVFRAYLLDVVVRMDCRGKGLGKALMKKILLHPRLRKMERIDLHCLPPLIPFYKKFGFKKDKLGIVRLSRRPSAGR